MSSHHGVGVNLMSLQPEARPSSNGGGVLGCRDILLEIIDRVNEVGETSDSEQLGLKKTLRDLGRTNKNNLPDCMDALWKDMHSITPFFALLPYEFSTIEPWRTPGRMPILSMNSTPSEHERFKNVAERLRSLTFGCAGTRDPVMLPPLSLIRLARLQPPGVPLFPHLKSVSFSDNHIAQAHALCMELLPGSPISRVSFTNLHIETASFISILSALVLFFTRSLRDLTLMMPEPQRVFSMDSLRFIPRLTFLTTLSITSANHQFPIYTLIPGIASELHLLQSLRIDTRVEGPSGSNEVLQNVRSNAAGLRHLRLGGFDLFLYIVLPVFSEIDGCAITLASVECFDQPTRDWFNDHGAPRVQRPAIRFVPLFSDERVSH